MTENLDILFGVTGQTLTFDAPEGVPSSITSTVYENSDGDEATAEAATTGAVAVPTVATTFDANSGPSTGAPRTLNLASTTGVATFARFRATNAGGEVETVEVSSVAVGSVEIRHALINEYVSGDTFESTTISHAIDATWVAAKNNISDSMPAPRYRWRLEYTAGGVVHVHHIYFDLVRYSGGTSVSGLDVDTAYPWLGWLNGLPIEDREDRGARIIKEAYRQVKLEIAQAGKADEAARNREVMEDLVMHKAAYLVAGKDLEALEVIKLNYDRAYNNFIIQPGLDFDDDGTGAASPSTASPIWRR